MKLYQTDYQMIAVTLLIGVIVAFFMADAFGGETELREAHIAGKIYVRPYTTHHTGYHTSKVGKTTISTPYHYTVDHPAQFYLLADDSGRYSVTEPAYDKAREGEPMILGRRIGRFTRWHYFWNLVAVSPKIERT
jgi:hypothetical protein